MTNVLQMTDTGKIVYDRTYARTKPDGDKETWPETVRRVVEGNLALVDSKYELPGERETLARMIEEFKLLPAGRHLWASGATNHLFNCWVSGWPDKISDHFHFTFMRLMEGGGVGANYSNKLLGKYSEVVHPLQVHIVCDREHIDYDEMARAGILSHTYDPDWHGSYRIEDSREGWAAALVDLIDTHYRQDTVHFQRVYDVSHIRHAGAKLKTFGGTASGPLPFAQMLQKVADVLSNKSGQRLTGLDAMSVDHAIAQCVVAGGVRRSARMSIMHWADPQIEDFIHCKSQSGEHWTTNISVEVDDTFWKQAKQGSAWHASKILKHLSDGAVRNGEPGMWDSSLSNVGEPGRVDCTNPCGEIALEEWEPCNLGHVNLAAFVREDGSTDVEDMRLAHRMMTRFLIRATFAQVGDPKSRAVLDRNRRIGLGHLGVASYLAMKGIRFSDAPKDSAFRSLLSFLAVEVDQAAGEFCHWLRIPVPVKRRTVAPTGTIAKLSGVSEGIHPIFSRYFIRRVRFNKLSDAMTLKQMEADGFHVEDDLFAPNTAVVSIPTKDTLVAAVEKLFGEDHAEYVVQSADELSLEELIAFQALYQELWADNAVSFTANVDPARYTSEDVGLVLQKFAGKIKGSTLFPEASFPQAPYERISRAEYEAAVAQEIGDGVDENCASGACPIR